MGVSGTVTIKVTSSGMAVIIDAVVLGPDET